MHPARIFIGVLGLIGIVALASHLSTLALAPEEGVPREIDLARPRAPAASRAIQNPVAASDDSVAAGRAIYHGKGACSACHGETGRGDGPAGEMTRPRPRDFTDPMFHALRNDGELFWTLKHGIPGTGMISFVPRILSESEAWTVIRYIRTLQADDPAAHLSPESGRPTG